MPTPEQSYRGYVYLIGSSKYGWYKIGKSKNAKIRVTDIGILLPFKIEVFGLWGTSNETILESEMHGFYSSKRINGEWFGFNGRDVMDVIGRISQYPSTLLFDYGNDVLFLPANLKRDREFGNTKEWNRLKSLAFMMARREWLKENALDGTLKQNKKASEIAIQENPDRFIKHLKSLHLESKVVST